MNHAAIQRPNWELQFCDSMNSKGLQCCDADLFSHIIHVICFYSITYCKLIIGVPLPPSAVYILLGAGGLMMIVGFFGCFGAVCESQCLLASVG